MDSSTKYSWSQDDGEITITYSDSHVSAQDVKCVLKGRNLRIEIKGEVILDGALLKTVVPLSAGWVVDEGQFLWYAQKADKRSYWEVLLEGDVKLEKNSEDSEACDDSTCDESHIREELTYDPVNICEDATTENSNNYDDSTFEKNESTSRVESVVNCQPCNEDRGCIEAQDEVTEEARESISAANKL